LYPFDVKNVQYPTRGSNYSVVFSFKSCYTCSNNKTEVRCAISSKLGQVRKKTSLFITSTAEREFIT